MNPKNPPPSDRSGTPSSTSAPWVSTVRAAFAGVQAQAAGAAAEKLFRATGERWISLEIRRAVQGAVTKTADRVLATSPALGAAKAIVESDAVRALSGRVRARLPASLRATSPAVLRAAEAGAAAAAKELAKNAGRAAGVGFVIDGAIAGFQGIAAVRRGEMEPIDAAKHAAREGAKGAFATAAGVVATGAVVAATGGLAAPVLFVIGAGTALGARVALDRWDTKYLKRLTAAAAPREAPEDAETVHVGVLVTAND